jgi:hypothetical protein
MTRELRVLQAHLHRRGGYLSTETFAEALSLVSMGLPPEKAIERALDLVYPERLRK